jgi:hypothetical protein
MKIIGIDPSLSCTAVCFTTESGASIVPVRVGPMGQSIESRFIRYSSIIERVRQVVHECGRDSIVFLEGYAFASKTAGVVLAEFGGLLRRMLLSEIKPGNLHEIPPTSLKIFVTNHGVAKKPVMAESAFRRWGAELSGDDEVDSYCLWRFGRAFLGLDEAEDAVQVRAIENVRNPVKKSRKQKPVDASAESRVRKKRRGRNL